MGGGMETNKNKFIEDWSSARKNLEHNFHWSRRNLALVGLFGIALPIFVYKGIVCEFYLPVASALIVGGLTLTTFTLQQAGRNTQQFMASVLWAGVTAGVMAVVKANGRQF